MLKKSLASSIGTTLKRSVLIQSKKYNPGPEIKQSKVKHTPARSKQDMRPQSRVQQQDAMKSLENPKFEMM